MLLAIDPGCQKMGWAVFGPDNKLVSCGSIVADNMEQTAKRLLAAVPHGITHGVTEYQQIYPGTKRPNDIVKLAFAAGLYVGCFEIPFTRVLPREWKGQVPKDVMIKRIHGRLTDDERRRIPELATYRRHDVLDAIGIGLWYLKRT